MVIFCFPGFPYIRRILGPFTFPRALVLRCAYLPRRAAPTRTRPRRTAAGTRAAGTPPRTRRRSGGGSAPTAPTAATANPRGPSAPGAPRPRRVPGARGGERRGAQGGACRTLLWIPPQIGGVGPASTPAAPPLSSFHNFISSFPLVSSRKFFCSSAECFYAQVSVCALAHPHRTSYSAVLWEDAGVQLCRKTPPPLWFGCLGKIFNKK